MVRSALLRQGESLLWFLGFTCLSCWAVTHLWTRLYTIHELARFDDLGWTDRLASVDHRPTLPTGTRLLEPGDVIGRIDIPRVGVSAVVLEGTADDLLRLGVGHIAGTSLPGRGGNSALAGHRDTLFRGLRHISADDMIRVTTAQGVQHYRVEATRIVGPSDVWVLGPTETSVLTLVTCYPFTWVGHAPKRFVVEAHQVGAVELPITASASAHDTAPGPAQLTAGR